MPALKMSTAEGFTVVYARHDRKGGGAIGESGRGTSQVGGDMDQMSNPGYAGPNERLWRERQEELNPTAAVTAR
jgi:hypothetical protein